MATQPLNRRAPRENADSPELDLETLAEPEEVLIADLRGRLSPAELVDRKLLALLGQSRRGGGRPT